MKIQYFGGSTFSIKSGDTTIILDPTSDKGVGHKKLAADIALISDPKYSDFDRVEARDSEKGIFKIDGQGEYEVGGIYVEGIAYHGKALDEDRDMVYEIRAEGIVVVYLGYINAPLTKEEIQRLNNVDILIAPVGNKSFISHEALDAAINIADPKIFIPTIYKDAGAHSGIKELESLDDFLKHIGIAEPDTAKTLTVKESEFRGEEDIPMRVVVLQK